MVCDLLDFIAFSKELKLDQFADHGSLCLCWK